MTGTPALLNVDKSLMEARWVLPQSEQAIVETIMREKGVPEILARMLSHRNIAPDDVDAYLYPRLARDFPDPFILKGMEDMAVYIADAVINGRKIGIFGDFDVDGATSTALLVRFFRHLGMDTPFYIPDRLSEGYGPNVNAFKALKKQGAEIVIICDCGVTAFDTLAAGKDLGLGLVVLDHHETEETLPPADHVIDPKRKDDSSGLDMLAACGVSFMACVAINKALRERGFYSEKGLEEPPLKSWLDIVALGTVCDMVPLTGVNRLLVKTGFTQMNDHPNAGIAALCDVAQVSGNLSPYHAGFVLGPRINAGSRVHKADLGARLLSTDNPEEAKNIAWTLNDCNDKRKDIQKDMADHAVGMVEAQGLKDDPLIMVSHEDWHPGLSGLVAGQLKERYGKPSVVITYATGEDGRIEGRGSGRSVPGFHMGNAFIAARQEGILARGGGHAMAAGFTVYQEQEETLRAFLLDQAAQQASGALPLPEVQVDGALSVRGAQIDFVRILQDHLGPFGQGHEEPLFVLPHVRVHMADIVGRDHVRCMISDWEGGSRLKAVAFRARDTALGRALLNDGRDRPLHIMGHFKLDTWNGNERVEMHIKDAAFALPAQENPDESLAAVLKGF